METSFTIRPKVVTITTPSGTTETTAEAIIDYFESVQDLARGTVVSKMRRGISAPDLSEQSTVKSFVSRGDKPSLMVFSYSVRAAIDEKGRRTGALPPFGLRTALREWAEFFLDTTDFHRVRGLAMAIYRRGQPAPGDPLGLNRPFARSLEELRPTLKEGLERTRAEVVARLNKPPAKGGPVGPRKSPFSGWRRGK